jgi:hypothetical protein
MRHTAALSVLIAAAGVMIVISPGGRQAVPLRPAANVLQQVNCTLTVPANPLSAQGLATPWVLSGVGAQAQACVESNPGGAAFVQGAVLDPATGAVSVYDPLVTTAGTVPAVAPTVPTLPANAVVGLWIGFNGNNLALAGAGAQQCVTGGGGSAFGQDSMCNAQAFFGAANQAVAAGKLKPPALGMARDGMACPTVRDFSIVDQDQSDNVTTTYLVTAAGQTAQNTPQNAAQVRPANPTVNGSDNRLLTVAVDGALGCAPWTAPDLADPTRQARATALPLDEIQAASLQAAPVATVPALDPMVLDAAGNPNLAKLNAFRVNVDQPAVQSLAMADSKAYCSNLLATGLPRIALDRQFTIGRPSPDAAAANNLFNFLATRFMNTFSNTAGFLMCTRLLGKPSPVTVQLDNNGVAVGAEISLNGIKPQPVQPPVPQAAAVVDCTLTVPANPLSARGLATPWVLSGAGAQAAACRQANRGGAAFVQGAVIDPATGAVSVYNPLVVTAGTVPAAAPTVPKLPANAVVGLWIGFNGNNLALAGPGVQQGRCVTGSGGSAFGQDSMCNAQAFFAAANQAIAAGTLKPPALGTARDGMPCPSVRDFSLVDQDQSDNVTTTYLVNAAGQTAQNTRQNAAALAGAVATVNGSDNRLLAVAVDGALGCTPSMAPDLADPTGQTMATALPLNELQAAAQQAAPVATVPALDPMVLDAAGNPNLNKLNAFRVNVDQAAVQSLAMADTRAYCSNLLASGLPRIALDRQFTIGQPSPDPAVANNLFNFLATRFQNTFSAQAGFLMCTQMLGVQNPVTVQMDNNGVTVGAQVNLHPAPPAPPAPTPPMGKKRHQ